MTRSILYCLLFILFISTEAHAFGRNGHRIVGLLAEKHLSAKAKKRVVELLEYETLAQVSTWPDEIRSDPTWKYADPWHYVSVPDGETYLTSEKNPQGDIIKALIKFENDLRDPKTKREDKITALKFLVHFVADLHMPLHVGLKGDKGGNDVKVQWFGEPSNLHKVIDTNMIQFQELSYTEYTDFLNHFSPAESKEWMDGTFLDWAAESQQQRNEIYKRDDDKLWYEYEYRVKPLVETRLRQAGLRLAHILNNVFEGKALNKAEAEMRAKVK